MQTQVILTPEQASSILGSVPQESNPASKKIKILGLVQTILSLVRLLFYDILQLDWTSITLAKCQSLSW